MYLAPLNFNRFFKKVFSDLFIAQEFLEDFLDIKIESIEKLTEKNKVTDDAIFIEFDFRCKINGQFIIIDMQQWYKAHVVKRFYLYQSLNCALQLETLPKLEKSQDKGRDFDDRVYNQLLPSITLIWMTDDNLGFKEDFISYALFPEQTAQFFENDDLWATNDVKKLDIERQKILTLLKNNTKGLDFLSQNRMIYAFQKNIVKNKKLTKYFKWFELAEKTRNKNNKEQDFATFKNDKTLMAVIERINTTKFNNEERTALEDLERELAYMAEWKFFARDEMIDEVRAEVKEMVREEVKLEVREEVKSEVREEVKSEVREEVTSKLKEDLTAELVISSFQNGLDIDLIAKITHTSIEKATEIIKNFKSK